MKTPEEILEVLNAIGKSVHVMKIDYHKRTAYHVDYVLSNGWEIRIFNECQSEFDYVEEVKSPGEDWIKLYDDKWGNKWDLIINRYSPSKEALEELHLS